MDPKKYIGMDVHQASISVGGQRCCRKTSCGIHHRNQSDIYPRGWWIEAAIDVQSGRKVESNIMMRMSVRTLLILSIATSVAAAPARDATSCESLAKLALPDTTITMAESVAAGAFTIPPGGLPIPGGVSAKNLPAFCRVAATIKPTSDSDIRVEVWLPASAWNGKFQAIGNGGWIGAIIYQPMTAALARGYATAGTDTGHQGGVMDASFALGHLEKVTDFGYRAVHEMTVKAKALISAFYGDAPKYSYWNGCSSGGKQGLKEAQKFPDDFNGIIAGAPANYWTHLTAASVWVGMITHKDPASFVPPAKFPVIHKAVLEACDALDGLKDGVIDDPRRCHFDLNTIECKKGDAPDCLTAAQADVVRQIYAPATNPRTKKVVYPGLEPGSELGWGLLAGGKEPAEIGATHYRYIVYKDPKWDWHSLDLDKSIALADELDNGTINATDPNLKPFFSHGGKLLMYHGWADPLIASENSIDYYQSVLAATGGAKKAASSIRLFMAPGMDHCFGGEGPNVFDAVPVIEQWVENGKTPDQIVASHMKGAAADRTRPLCPYPQVARYKGSGSIDDAANFTCVQP
jgi:feruloyl esterase